MSRMPEYVILTVLYKTACLHVISYQSSEGFNLIVLIRDFLDWCLFIMYIARNSSMSCLYHSYALVSLILLVLSACYTQIVNVMM